MNIIDQQPDNKLTKRQVNNLRSIWMRKAHQLGDRIIASVLGEDVEQPCKCGETISFPGTGEALSTAQIGAAKIIFSKVFPDIAPEDFNAATDEPKTPEEIAQSLLSILTEDKLKDMVKTDINKARAIGQDLIELSSSKVRAIK